MNFGAFGGGFSQGFNSGVQMAKSIRDIIKERKLEDLRTQGMEEARNARSQAVNGMISENAPPEPKAPAEPKAGAPTAQPAATASPAPAPASLDDYLTTSPTASPDAASAKTAASSMPPSLSTQTPAAGGLPSSTKADAAPVTPDKAPAQAQAQPQASASPGGFFVNGKAYKTRDEAYKAADAAAPSTLDFFMKTSVPKLQEEYIAQGDPAKAEAWGQWAASKKNQAAMQEWASMYRAAQFGDMEKAADHAFNLYKRYDDGITPVSKETVKDKDGNVTGFNVRLKNEATGEVTSQFIDRRAMVEMGMAALAPDKLFEVSFQRQASADKAAAEARVKAQEKRQEFQEKVILQDRKEDRTDAREGVKGRQKLSEISLRGQIDKENLGEGEKAKANAKIDLLKQSGYSDEQIAAMVPAIVGAGEHKKTTDPTERRALIASDLVKNDPTFARLPPAERNKRVDEMMSVIYGDQGGQPGGGPAAGASGGGQGPVYVRDTKTGEIFKMENGQRVPIQAPTASPAPAAAPAAPKPQSLVRSPSQVAAGGLPAPAAPPAPAPVAPPAPAAPAAPAARMTVEQALNRGGNPEISKIMAPKAQQIRDAWAQVQQLQQQTAQAAASGDQKAVVAAARAQQDARSRFEALLADMDPGMRSAVMAAVSQ